MTWGATKTCYRLELDFNKDKRGEENAHDISVLHSFVPNNEKFNKNLQEVDDGYTITHI